MGITGTIKGDTWSLDDGSNETRLMTTAHARPYVAQRGA